MNFSEGTLLSHEAQEEIFPFFDTFSPCANVVEGSRRAETTTAEQLLIDE
jgi:hypothetical protein